MSVSPARAAAFDILLRVDQEDAYASELLHSERCASLTAVDQGLTTELVMGVLRWRSALDEAIANVSSQNLARLDPEVLTSLRLGAYQLGWLDRVPARAAIHESVELVKRARKRSAAPFANAILRKLAEKPAQGNARVQPLLSTADSEALAHTSAHPLWLVQRWTAQFGIETTARTCAFNQSTPVTAIRLREASAEEELRREGIDVVPGSMLATARRVAAGDVTKTKAYRDGRVAIQDEASQLVAALVGRGSRILDCCAAPGGKTWAIADRNPDAGIVAVELHERRAQILRKRVPTPNVEVITGDIRQLPVGDLFERVLVDAPCSGTGTIARNPEIKWRLRPEDLLDLRGRQLAILQAAAKHVAPGGALIYATCSLEQEEDESVIEETLRAESSLRLQDVRPELERLRSAEELTASLSIKTLVKGSYLRTTPGVQPTDGFFAAILRREP
ncbi:MAG TPA: 16S rRNA (cytosine(967)-C(5))-methyltransferase RsmB [Terriglobales bacterium]|nr:16S rRNA (cytosine(967)-C(5))-methyltransferase RsmB [Terriglobales bacterium]